MSEKDLETTPEEEELDLENEIVELVDDDGNVIKFKFLDVTEYRQKRYALLLAAEPNENIEEDEVVIFELDEENEMLLPIEDDKLLQEVFDFYNSEADADDYDDGGEEA